MPILLLLVLCLIISEIQLPSRSTARSKVSAISEMYHMSAVEINTSYDIEKPSYDDINWDFLDFRFLTT
jgi:hypothetical protein